MNGRDIYEIIGEYRTDTIDGFFTILPTKKLNGKETLDIFRYIYYNCESGIPIRVENTFEDACYFDYIKREMKRAMT